jgi:hypothetical protein
MMSAADGSPEAHEGVAAALSSSRHGIASRRQGVAEVLARADPELVVVDPELSLSIS